MITRRTFLRVAGLGAVPVAAGLFAGRDGLAWFFSRTGARLGAMTWSPERRLRAHFDYLDIDPKAITQFCQDLRRHRPDFSPRLPLGPDVHTGFLLSTDFFLNGADETRTVRYVAYYDPSATPCYNPLARFDESSES